MATARNWFASGITPGATNSFNQSPIVSLQSPLQGATFRAPAFITLTADARDDDGTILQLDFLDGRCDRNRDAASIHAGVECQLGIHSLVARARDNRLAVAVSAPISITVEPPPVGDGTGLRGDYYDNSDFTGTRVRRVDPTVNFDWGGGAPDLLIGADSFSVRWTGSVQPRFSETYTFYTVSDDGIRLWVNNTLLVDDWTDHGPTETRTHYIAGRAALQHSDGDVQNGGGAVAKLLWSSPTVLKETIPSTQLYPPSTLNLPPNVSLDSPTGGVVIAGSPVSLVATASDPDGSVQRVEFFDGTTSLGAVLQPPYTLNWASPPLWDPCLARGRDGRWLAVPHQRAGHPDTPCAAHRRVSAGHQERHLEISRHGGESGECLDGLGF